MCSIKGDFSTILYVNEKLGGNPPVCSIDDFHESISLTKLKKKRKHDRSNNKPDHQNQRNIEGNTEGYCKRNFRCYYYKIFLFKKAASTS